MNPDEKYMAEALRLARNALGNTSPNPVVGAVIVKGGKIIGRGYHKRAGMPHAEIEAIKGAKAKLRGATLYVTLEPCCHHGRTPPCTRAIIDAGISRVVAAMHDPNPIVSGRGIRELQNAGIKVEVGPLENEAKKLNEIYINHITTGLPFITSKIAMSLDGKIATSSGESRWITCEESRAYVHRLRKKADAILVGVNTIIKDNPRLTCRLPGKKERHPVRVIADSRLRTPIDSQLLRLQGETVIATTKLADERRKKELEKNGAKIITVPGKDGHVNLRSLFKTLGKMGITSILSEGGSEMNASILSENLADRYLFFIAPSIIGGRDSMPAFGGSDPGKMADIKKLEIIQTKKIGRDLLVEARRAGAKRRER